ncbi:MAG TPA: ABC transporter substrate-binding protein [Candidatus Binatia bacterium]
MSHVQLLIAPLLLCAMLLAPCFAAWAQQPKKVPRIVQISSVGDANNPGYQVEAVRQGLRDLGYVEGKNIRFDHRHIQANRKHIPDLVAEVLQSKPDALVLDAPSAVRAAKERTKTVPIVMIVTTDPVSSSLVESLAHPGGNVTGISRLTRDLSGKRLELLQEVVPSLSRVAILSVSNPTFTASSLNAYETAARTLKLPLESVVVDGPKPDLEGAFQNAIGARASAMVVVSHNVLVPYRRRIAELALKNKLASISESGAYPDAGGLMSYASNDMEAFRRAALYVDKILKGTKPADLPIEQPTKFELVLNLSTAKQIGLAIPQSVLFRADRVIR